MNTTLRRSVVVVSLSTALFLAGRQAHGAPWDGYTVIDVSDAALSNPDYRLSVANLNASPPVGAYIIALPMKIADGSGAPLRIIGFLPD